LQQKLRRAGLSAESHQEIIKFRDYLATMYDSIVWQVLPKLKSLSIDANIRYLDPIIYVDPYGFIANCESFIYTRSTWEAYQKLAQI